MASCAQTKNALSASAADVIPGAERMAVYLPMLKGKTVAVFANQTNTVALANAKADRVKEHAVAIKYRYVLNVYHL